MGHLPVFRGERQWSVIGPQKISLTHSLPSSSRLFRDRPRKGLKKIIFRFHALSLSVFPKFSFLLSSPPLHPPVLKIKRWSVDKKPRARRRSNWEGERESGGGGEDTARPACLKLSLGSIELRTSINCPKTQPSPSFLNSERSWLLPSWKSSSYRHCVQNKERKLDAIGHLERTLDGPAHSKLLVHSSTYGEGETEERIGWRFSSFFFRLSSPLFFLLFLSVPRVVLNFDWHELSFHLWAGVSTSSCVAFLFKFLSKKFVSCRSSCCVLLLKSCTTVWSLGWKNASFWWDVAASLLQAFDRIKSYTHSSMITDDVFEKLKVFG